MKLFKKINICSNGSLYFCYKVETSVSKNKPVFFQKIDDKIFALNQKKAPTSIDSRHSLSYKKKYLK
jgi:hypothetical protein